jgi:hypothetical protein
MVFYVAALVLAGGVVVAALFARRRADPLVGPPGATVDKRLAA